MAVRLVCNPSLGQSTVIQGNKVNITILLLSNLSGVEWQAALWHDNTDTEAWAQIDLASTELDISTISDGSLDFTFSTSFTCTLIRNLHKERSVRFTIKYRLVGTPWIWANEALSLADAEIIFVKNMQISPSLSFYIDNLDPSCSISACNGDGAGHSSPIAQVWSISNNIAAAVETRSTFSHMKLGYPKNFSRWFCLARESLPWLCPRQGYDLFDLEGEAIAVSFLRRDGIHMVVIALSMDDLLSTITASEKGELVIVARNDRPQNNTVHVVAALGNTFDTAFGAAMSHASIIKNSGISKEIEMIQQQAVSSSEPSLETWYNSFAYCTWNGLGQNLTEEKICGALDTMVKAGVKFSTLIIDDNWQSIDDFGPNNFHHRWVDFEADKQAFPRGLKQTLTTIRAQYPCIKHIPVWHGIMGYWNGISPDGHIAKCYKTKFLKKQDRGFFGGGSLLAVDADDATLLYDDFYQFLSDCGVDSVKTDTQFLLDQISDASDRARFTTAYQNAWTKAHIRHFSARAISCMSQAPAILFHSQFLKNLPKLMVRNSEDFFPDEPTSHAWHVFCNAHNNVLTEHLNVLPDWDMFQTSHEYSTFHAAARCVSGGPIYFTDKPGEHDISLIAQMTARSPSGDVTILRPNVGTTTNVYTSNKEMRLLKIGTSTMGIGTPMLGIFNVNSEALSEMVGLENFSNISPTEVYIVRGHKSGQITRPTKLEDLGNPILLHIGVKGYEILTAYPLHRVVLSKALHTAEFAVLGLVDKMAGAVAVLETSYNDNNGGINISVRLSAMGLLGLYVSPLGGDFMQVSRAMICNKAIPMWLIQMNVGMKVVTVDVEKAWDSLKGSDQCEKLVIDLFIQPSK